MKVMTIQPANMPNGGYDVRQSKLYPFHVNAESGEVLGQDLWRGEPKMILGFQKDVDVQKMDRLLPDLAKSANDAHLAVGMFPVCVDWKGRIYTFTLPIESVTLTEQAEEFKA